MIAICRLQFSAYKKVNELGTTAIPKPHLQLPWKLKWNLFILSRKIVQKFKIFHVWKNKIDKKWKSIHDNSTIHRVILHRQNEKKSLWKFLTIVKTLKMFNQRCCWKYVTVEKCENLVDKTLKIWELKNLKIVWRKAQSIIQ